MINMSRKGLFMIFLFFNFSYVYSQNIQLIFHAKFHGQEVVIGQKLDDYQFKKLKFYISDVQLYGNGAVLTGKRERAYLIDLSNQESSRITLPTSAEQMPQRIQFMFGLDSAINCSGDVNAALDPVKGMYWSWQSGYIHFSTEWKNENYVHKGKTASLHLGGYRKGVECLQRIELRGNGSSEVHVYIELDELVTQIESSSMFTIMSPGTDAKKIFQVVSKSIH